MDVVTLERFAGTFGIELNHAQDFLVVRQQRHAHQRADLVVDEAPRHLKTFIANDVGAQHRLAVVQRNRF